VHVDVVVEVDVIVNGIVNGSCHDKIPSRPTSISFPLSLFFRP
jgi:hypothetical protein